MYRFEAVFVTILVCSVRAIPRQAPTSVVTYKYETVFKTLPITTFTQPTLPSIQEYDSNVTTQNISIICEAYCSNYSRATTSSTVYAALPSSATPSSPSPPDNTASRSPGYIEIVNKWRTKLKLVELEQDSTLEANALKTCVDGDGQMIHELNPESLGQILAPGQPDEFERVFVGGWLCEKPDLPGLDGVCSTASVGWAYHGQTGHADILTSFSYSRIGCGNAKGIWGCDLA